MSDIELQLLNHSTVHIKAGDGIIRELSDLFTFEVPNSKFHPAYKNRLWDGKIRLLDSRKHTIMAGLIPYIHKFARENSYELVDLTDFNVTEEFSLAEAKTEADALGLPFEPNEHQMRAFALSIRHKRAVIVSPTASGKSLIAYLLAMHYHVKTLITVPTISLVMQLQKDFEEYGFKGKIHAVTAGVEKKSDADITISTWQSIYEQPKEFFKDFGMMIGDEAHNFKAKSLISIMTKMEQTPYRFGMTGTLDGAEVNELVLTGLFGPVLNIVKSKELMNKGIIANLNPIKILVLQHPREACKSLVNKTYAGEMDCIVSCDARNKFIRNLALSLEGNTLVLFAYVEKHGKILFDLINSKSDNAHFVSGAVQAQDREDIRGFAESSDNAIIVASYGTFSTGINIKRLHNIIFASPTKSRIRTLQSIGRGLRMGEDKSECNLFDIADDLSYNKKKNFTLNHMIERVKMYSTEGFPYELHTIKLRSESNGPNNLF